MPTNCRAAIFASADIESAINKHLEYETTSGAELETTNPALDAVAAHVLGALGRT